MAMKKTIAVFIFIALSSALSGCGANKIASGIAPVENFDSDRYLGTWYEIARMDMFFERGLYNVTANYSLNDDGTIKVVNRGYKLSSEEWKSVTGKAKFVGDENTGHLKVSFFGPFYASYVVYELDAEYQYAFVTGGNKKILWLLARTPDVSDELVSRFTQEAKALGYDMNNMIFDVQREELPR